jgi:hypothetical protein
MRGEELLNELGERVLLASLAEPSRFGSVGAWTFHHERLADRARFAAHEDRARWLAIADRFSRAMDARYAAGR